MKLSWERIEAVLRVMGTIAVGLAFGKGIFG